MFEDKAKAMHVSGEGSPAVPAEAGHAPVQGHGHGEDPGYDTHEPSYGLVALFGLATVVGVIASVLAVQAFYDSHHEREVFIKVLEPVAEDLRNLRAQEQNYLHSYQYIDRQKGSVRLPIERAMQLLAAEAAAGKLPYSTKPAPVKVEQPADAAQVPAQAGAALQGGGNAAVAQPGPK